MEAFFSICMVFFFLFFKYFFFFNILPIWFYLSFFFFVFVQIRKLFFFAFVSMNFELLIGNFSLFCWNEVEDSTISQMFSMLLIEIRKSNILEYCMCLSTVLFQILVNINLIFMEILFIILYTVWSINYFLWRWVHCLNEQNTYCSISYCSNSR